MPCPDQGSFISLTIQAPDRRIRLSRICSSNALVARELRDFYDRFVAGRPQDEQTLENFRMDLCSNFSLDPEESQSGNEVTFGISGLSPIKSSSVKLLDLADLDRSAFDRRGYDDRELREWVETAGLNSGQRTSLTSLMSRILLLERPGGEFLWSEYLGGEIRRQMRLRYPLIDPIALPQPDGRLVLALRASGVVRDQKLLLYQRKRAQIRNLCIVRQDAGAEKRYFVENAGIKPADVLTVSETLRQTIREIFQALAEENAGSKVEWQRFLLRIQPFLFANTGPSAAGRFQDVLDSLKHGERRCFTLNFAENVSDSEAYLSYLTLDATVERAQPSSHELRIRLRPSVTDFTSGSIANRFTIRIDPTTRQFLTPAFPEATAVFADGSLKENLRGAYNEFMRTKPREERLLPFFKMFVLERPALSRLVDLDFSERDDAREGKTLLTVSAVAYDARLIHYKSIAGKLADAAGTTITVNPEGLEDTDPAVAGYLENIRKDLADDIKSTPYLSVDPRKIRLQHLVQVRRNPGDDLVGYMMLNENPLTGEYIAPAAVQPLNERENALEEVRRAVTNIEKGPGPASKRAFAEVRKQIERACTKYRLHETTILPARIRLYLPEVERELPRKPADFYALASREERARIQSVIKDRLAYPDMRLYTANDFADDFASLQQNPFVEAVLVQAGSIPPEEAYDARAKTVTYSLARAPNFAVLELSGGLGYTPERGTVARLTGAFTNPIGYLFDTPVLDLLSVNANLGEASSTYGVTYDVPRLFAGSARTPLKLEIFGKDDENVYFGSVQSRRRSTGGVLAFGLHHRPWNAGLDIRGRIEHLEFASPDLPQRRGSSLALSVNPEWRPVLWQSVRWKPPGGVSVGGLRNRLVDYTWIMGLRGSLEHGFGSAGGRAAWTKAAVEFDTRLAWGRAFPEEHYAGVKIGLGTASRGTPFYEQFRLGGDSLRGYQEGERIGRRSFHSQMELGKSIHSLLRWLDSRRRSARSCLAAEEPDDARLAAYRKIYLAAFVDTGGADARSFFSDTRVGSGLGLRFLQRQILGGDFALKLDYAFGFGSRHRHGTLVFGADYSWQR